MRIQEGANRMCVRAIYLKEHNVSIIRVSEFSNNLVPRRLELLAPVTILHIDVKHDYLITVSLLQDFFQLVEACNTIAESGLPPV